MDENFFRNETYEQFQLKLTDLLENEEIKVDDLASSILEYLPCGISIVARDGTYLYVNDLYAKKLGYSYEELVLKKTVMDITVDLPPEDLLQNLQAAHHFGQVRKGVGSYNVFKKTWRHATGQTVAGVCKASRFYFRKNGMTCVIAIIAFEEKIGEYDKLIDFHEERARPIHETVSYHLAAAKTHVVKAYQSWRNT